jgi:hypothetical protein
LSGKVDFERNRDISPIDGTLGSVTLQPVKTYALQNISSCTSASTELEKLLPAQRTPWLLKTHDGDVIAYFKVLPKENGSEWHGHCVTADVSGRHYNEDAAVISALRQLQLAVGGEITDDNGSVVRFLF